jgi:CubicO group peptidase (beta-lactamase class C family)
VSQVLTAAAAGVLADRGLLDLDAPVQRYVPAFPEKPWPVTTRQLLGHVGGVRDFPDEHERLSADHCGTTAEALEPFAADPLLFRPGTEFRHSTYGYVLVSAAVEAAAKEPFLLFIQREVFEPLGMNDTGPDSAAGDDPGRASFYFPRFMERASLGLQPTRPVDYSCFSGAGAFLSTPSDLARFGSAMLRGGLLRADTAAMLQAPIQLESGASTGRALGWKPETVALHGAPARLVGRASNPFGGTASLLMFPDHGLAIALTSNVSYARSLAPFGLQLAELFASARQPKRPD